MYIYFATFRVESLSKSLFALISFSSNGLNNLRLSPLGHRDGATYALNGVSFPFGTGAMSTIINQVWDRLTLCLLIRVCVRGGDRKLPSL